MYCNQCGLNIDDNSRFCPGCGKGVQQQPSHLGNIGQPSVAPYPPANPGDNITTYFDNTKPGDEGGAFWWGVLCFFVPIVGFVLFGVWLKKYPKRAKVCLICAIICLVYNVAYSLITSWDDITAGFNILRCMFSSAANLFPSSLLQR